MLAPVPPQRVTPEPPQFLNNNLSMAVGLSRCGQREETVAPNSSTTSHSIVVTTATIARGAMNDFRCSIGHRQIESALCYLVDPSTHLLAKQAAVILGAVRG